MVQILLPGMTFFRPLLYLKLVSLAGDAGLQLLGFIVLFLAASPGIFSRECVDFSFHSRGKKKSRCRICVVLIWNAS